PAITKHVKVLERAELVRRERYGRIHRMHLQAKPMRDARAFIDEDRRFWEARFDALERFLSATSEGEPKGGRAWVRGANGRTRRSGSSGCSRRRGRGCSRRSSTRSSSNSGGRPRGTRSPAPRSILRRSSGGGTRWSLARRATAIRGRSCTS